MLIDQYLNKIRTKKKAHNNSGDRPFRSFVKALSWRFLGTLDTILLSWIISGRLDLAFSIGLFELLTKTLLYYFHERLWGIIKWGKQ